MTIHRFDVETGWSVCQHPPAVAMTALADAVDCPQCLDLLRRRAEQAQEPGEVVPFPAPAPTPTRRTAVGHRYRCFVGGSTLCDRGAGRPNRAVCRHCGSTIEVETGQWAAFHWAMTGEYPLIDAVATFASRALADEAAEARNLVVRFVPDGAQ